MKVGSIALAGTGTADGGNGVAGLDTGARLLEQGGVVLIDGDEVAGVLHDDDIAVGGAVVGGNDHAIGDASDHGVSNRGDVDAIMGLGSIEGALMNSSLQGR